MNNLPELRYEEARSIIEMTRRVGISSTKYHELDYINARAKLITILIESRSPKISDEVFRKGIEDIINPYGLTPEPEAGITLPPGSVQDHPANDAHNVAAAVMEAKP